MTCNLMPWAESRIDNVMNFHNCQMHGINCSLQEFFTDREEKERVKAVECLKGVV